MFSERLVYFLKHNLPCPYLTNAEFQFMMGLFLKLFNFFCSSKISITLKYVLKHLTTVTR